VVRRTGVEIPGMDQVQNRRVCWIEGRLQIMVGSADCSGLINSAMNIEQRRYIQPAGGLKHKPVTPRYANYVQTGESASIRMII
jgi:hypothetical protein